jgi:hypothetical protein
MSKLELPADVADKVIGMLKPKHHPLAVMIFKEGCFGSRAPHQRTIVMKAGALSEEELSFLVGNRPIITWEESNCPEFAGKTAYEHHVFKKETKGKLELDLHKLDVMNEAREAAILLGFQYRDKKEDSLIDIMYREAHQQVFSRHV